MSSKSLAFVLLTLLAAAVAWLALRGDGDQLPAARPGGDAPAGAPAAPAAPAAVDPATGVATAPQDGSAPLRSAAAPDAPAGSRDSAVAMFTVRGRLVDGSGQPRAGVVVALESWRDNDDIELLGVPAEALRRGARGNDVPSTKTGADGGFALLLRADHAGVLQLPGDELVFAKDAPSVRGKQGDQDLGAVTALAAARLAGVVRDERGQPVADVKVSAFRSGSMVIGGQHTATTGADGRFAIGKLRAGTWRLRTASGAFLPAEQEVALAAEERRADLVLLLAKGQAISGQVVDDRGQPVAGAKVGSKRKEARGGLDIERFTPDEAATTDANGFFTLAGLTGDSATVRAFGKGYVAAVAPDVPVGTGNLVLRVERTATIAGVLQGRDGTPIAGSRVRAVPGRAGAPEGDLELVAEVDGLPIVDGRPTATTGADGSFRIEGVRPGAVALVAEGKTHRPVRQEGLLVQPGQTVEQVRLQADLGATARVRVTDEQGQPVAGAKVRAERPAAVPAPGGAMRFTARAREVSEEDGAVHIRGSDEPLGTATTDAQGFADVTGLPAGPAVLRAQHADFAAAAPANVVLPAAGAVEASLQLRQPGFAAVTVLGSDGAPCAEAEFRIEGSGPDAGEPRRGTTDANGKATVGPLAAGSYTAVLVRKAALQRFGDAMVAFGGDGPESLPGSERTFQVAAGATVAVELRRPLLTRLHGVVTGAHGPVAGCRIELAARNDLPDGIPDFGARSAETAADGTFAFDDVEAGAYTLRYGQPEQLVKASQDVDVPSGLAELRQDLSLRTGKLRVQAWSKSLGQPIAGAEVEVVPAAKAGSGGAPRQERRVMMVTISTTDSGGEATTMTSGSPRAKTGADGWAEVDAVPAGEYVVRVRHDQHVEAQSAAQTVAVGQTTDAGRVELGQAGRIRGKVVSADGKPVRMALVFRRAAGSTEQGEPSPAMGGSFRMDGLAPGRYLLKAQALSIGPGGGPGGFGPEVEIEVKGAETTAVELQLPAK